MNVRYVEVNEEEANQRLDNYLLRVLKGVPKSHIYRIIRGGEVRVNKKRAAPSTRIQAGDQIRIPPIRTAAERAVIPSEGLTERLLKSIIYEDAQLMVVNKPAGLAVHGGSGVNFGVIEALRKVRDDLPYLELVHRLDRDTSGCLLLAKKRSALRAIHALLEARDVKKTYWAMLSHAWVGKEALTVNAPLDKNILKSGERMVAVDEAGKASSTAFKLIENFSAACWVEASPKTGRTHQIRVHSAYIGHPILGDEKYGYDGPKKSHLYLHARAIQFNLNGIDHRFEAEPEPFFLDEIQKLKKQ